MPVINGFDLMRQIRQNKNKNHLGLIVVAASDNDVAAKFLKNGANDFISVPFSKEEIIYRVDSNLKAMQDEINIELYKKYDPLTKLFNRRYFFNYVKNLAERKAEFSIAIIDIDGLRVIFKDGWGLIRASNTTPVLVTRFEAKTNLAKETYQNALLGLLKKD